VPVVPSYGSPDEYSLQQRQLTWQPTRGAWPAAAPRGLRPIGGNMFGGSPFGAQRPGYSGSAIAGYNDLLAQFMTRLNGGGGFAQR
jgi:hypothetical protein